MSITGPLGNFPLLPLAPEPSCPRLPAYCEDIAAISPPPVHLLASFEHDTPPLAPYIRPARPTQPRQLPPSPSVWQASYTQAHHPPMRYTCQPILPVYRRQHLSLSSIPIMHRFVGAKFVCPTRSFVVSDRKGTRNKLNEWKTSNAPQEAEDPVCQYMHRQTKEIQACCKRRTGHRIPLGRRVSFCLLVFLVTFEYPYVPVEPVQTTNRQKPLICLRLRLRLCPDGGHAGFQAEDD